MPKKQIAAIKEWIKLMGFKLVKSHILKAENTRINYYSLGNFGVYEKIIALGKRGKPESGIKLKFTSWTPWGIDFEVNSVKDLSKAYQESLNYNPDLALE